MLVHVRVYVSMLEEVYYREAKIDVLIDELYVCMIVDCSVQKSYKYMNIIIFFSSYHKVKTKFKIIQLYYA